MGGDFSGKNQDCAKGVYALAGNSLQDDRVDLFAMTLTLSHSV